MYRTKRGLFTESRVSKYKLQYLDLSIDALRWYKYVVKSELESTFKRKMFSFIKYTITVLYVIYMKNKVKYSFRFFVS